MDHRQTLTMPLLGLVCITASAQPANDSCSTVVPEALAAGATLAFIGDNTGATTENDGAFSAYPTVWHAFTTTECTDLVVSYCTTTPAFANIWLDLSADCPPTTTFGATGFNDADCGNGNFTIFYTEVPAGSYWLGVLADVGAAGPYSVMVTATACNAPPANDNCINAAALTVFDLNNCPGNATAGDNSSATEDGPEPTCAPGGIYMDLWYSFNSGTAAQMTINLAPGTMTDWNMVVYQACGGAEDTCVVHPVDPFLLPVTPNTDYVVRVFTDPASGDPGTFDICVSADLSTALTELHAVDWSIHPNPTSDVLFVTFSNFSGNLRLELVDASGRVVYAQDQTAHRDVQVALDLAGRLAPGMYALRAESAGWTVQRIVIVQ